MSTAQPPFVRFWRGYKLPELSRAEMLDKLQTKLVPHTAMVGAGHGLDAYLPVVPRQVRGNAFPVDETALVIYSSQADYDQIRSWKSGAEYGREHNDIFQPRSAAPPFNSHSTVATVYQGQETLAPDTAYVLSGMPGEQWQTGFNAFRILRRPESMAPEAFLAESKQLLDEGKGLLDSGLNDAAVLIDPDYLLVYENWTDKDAQPPGRQESLERRFDVYQSTQLRDEAADTTSGIREGDGINVRFDPEVDLPNGDLPADVPVGQ